MTAKMIPVVTMTDALLTSSTIAENDHPVWSSGTTYALNDNVIKGHKIWIATQGSNLNHDPETDDGAWWSEGLATNRWKVFDGYIQDQASQATSMAWEITPAQNITAVSFFNLDADSVTVTQTDPTAGVVYDETIDLTETSAVFDGWSYFFGAIVTRSNLCLTDLLPYPAAVLDITVTNTGGTAKLGQLAIGYYEELGITSDQVPIGIDDYTRLNEDEFGRTSPAIRGYARTASPMIMVDTPRIRYLERIVAAQRGLPTVWAFDTRHADNDLVYIGYFRRFSMVYQFASKATFDLEIRSLV
jgi:hypothetical protein